MTALPSGALALATRYRRQLSFGVVGAGVMAVGFLILLLLTGPAGVSPHVAYLVQAVVSVELSFALSRYWTWGDRRGRTRSAALREWRRFHASRVVSVPANQALFSLLIVSGAGVWLSNAICIALTTAVNWLVGHHLVFGPDEDRRA
ncbi:MAG TPA: GtrA family protein [Baekduia sp.]|uniref:GtrA family protein n=1 Tax=Baekduia sp. TaxID=2600305 RepID=UPI002D772ACE|nr:GtrA family protein [Baekduia sp.]HET6508483.1 GtrA family protein [Baekduia sp.]